MHDDKKLEEFIARGKLQLNLAHAPKHTYIFDEYTQDDLENILDKIKMFADIELGITMEDFVLSHKVLSSIFTPVCSFNDLDEEN